jgi:hypothetical protein
LHARIRRGLAIPAVAATITAGLSITTASPAQAAPFAHWGQVNDTQDEIIAAARAYEAENDVNCTVTNFTFHETLPDPTLGIAEHTYWSAEITCYK